MVRSTMLQVLVLKCDFPRFGGDRNAHLRVSLRALRPPAGVPPEGERRAADGVEIAVQDHGHGISAEHLPQLFDSFFTTKAEGMGMGLSIARSMVAAHGGRIWAENLPAGGALFRFTIPEFRGDALA